MTLLLIALNALAFALEAFWPASLIEDFALWPLHPVGVVRY